jgi:hypothetical protein
MQYSFNPTLPQALMAKYLGTSPKAQRQIDYCSYINKDNNKNNISKNCNNICNAEWDDKMKMNGEKLWIRQENAYFKVDLPSTIRLRKT